MNEPTLIDRLESRLEAVCETAEATDRLEANPLQQHFVFELEYHDPMTVTMTPHTTSLSVDAGRVEGPEPFDTTTITLTVDAFESLLEGDYLSRWYLDGRVDVRGLQPAWLLLGRLFGINHDLQRDGL